MKSFRDRNPYAVGLITVLVLGAATGFAFMVGTLKLLEDTYAMEGVFADASGLRSGDDVRLAGVKVGRVTGIEVDRASGNVRVDWVVDRGIDIGEDAHAEIALKSLLGAKHIRINNPMAGDRLMADLPAEQRTVPLERTEVPFDVFELTRIATEGIEELDTDALNEFLVDLADITDGKAATVDDLLTGIRRVGAAVNQRDEQFRSLLEQADRLSETLSDKDDEIVGLLDSSQRILDLIVERRNDLALVLGETADSVQELDRVIAENRAEIDGALDSLAPTLDVVAANQADVDRALAWLGPGLLQQSRGGGQGPWQDIFVRGLGPDVLGGLQDVYDVILGGQP